MKKTEKSFRTIRECLKLIKRLDSGLIPILIGLALFTGINPVLNTFILSYALDGMAAQAAASDVILSAVIGFALVFLLAVLASLLRKAFTVRASRAYIRFEMYTGDKAMEMDYPQLESPGTYKLRDRITVDRNWGSGIWGVFSALHLFCTFFFTLLASVVLLAVRYSGTPFFQSWQAIVYMGFLVGFTFFLSGLSVKLSGKIIDEMNWMSSSRNFRIFRFYLYENGVQYQQGKDVRIYRADKMIWSNLSALMREVKTGAVKRSSNFGGINGGMKSGFKALVSGGSYLFVALLAHDGVFSYGDVFLLASTLLLFADAFLRCVQGAREMDIATGRLDSTLEYVRLPGILYRGTIPVEKRSDYEYELEFHNVSFQYPGSDEYALKHLNLKLRIGQRLAVVGMNGSGKTTMIKLLCRLYDPTEGEITLNGIDIKKYKYDEYMGLFGVVFQDFKLFSFTLGQNVAASAEINNEKAEQCLEKVGFGYRLRDMPDCLDTCLYKDFSEDGIDISGGEAQKIALARALYKDAPFIILDEPTAALDPITEFDVYSRMNEIVGERTVIFISHRLSSCRFCHDIAVFHEGELVQRGSHDALVSDENGKYNALWNAQAQYYTD